MDPTFLYDTFVRLLGGVPLTLQLAFSSIGIGLVAAILLALMMRAWFRPIAWIADSFVFVFRGTPLLVQIFLIY